jgi:hypothetical protein
MRGARRVAHRRALRELRLYRVSRDEEGDYYLCKRVEPRFSRANEVHCHHRHPRHHRHHRRMLGE